MLLKKMKIWDLDEIRKLLMTNLQIPTLDLTASLIHFIFNILTRLLGSSTFFGIVAQAQEDNIVGLIIVRRFPLAKIWVIGPVVVDKEYRNQGIGAHLVRSTLKTLLDKRADGVIVSINNRACHSAARKLFRQFGFKIILKVFASPKQIYKCSRMISKGQPLSKIKQGQMLITPDFEIPKRYIYSVFLKNLRNIECNKIYRKLDLRAHNY